MNFKSNFEYSDCTGAGFADNLNGTVTDHLTGLIWLKDAGSIGVKSWVDALTTCNDLSVAEHAGLSDDSVVGEWRLPNLNELLSLIDRRRSNPTLPLNHPFTGVQLSDFYWSSMTLDVASGANHAWLAPLTNRFVTNCFKTGTYYVWPVRGGL